MLINAADRNGHRNIYYDVVGPETGPVVCCAHSLSSDSGIWAEHRRGIEIDHAAREMTPSLVGRVLHPTS